MPSSKHTCSSFPAALLLAALLALPACGEKEPAKSGDWMDHLKVQNPGAEPDLGGADEDPVPTAKEEPAPKPDTKAKPSSGRPLIQYGPKSLIESTFGVTPGSKLQLNGGVTLVIPEYALDTGYNIVFKVAGSSAPKNGPVVGSIAYLKVNPGTKLRSKKVKSRGDLFQVRMGTGAADTINLAIGEVATDDNGNESGKPTWRVVAPTKVNKAVGIVGGAEETTYNAVFELTTIGPILYLHGTTADPT